MTRRARSERTARLLSARLAAAVRAPAGRERAYRLELVSVATRNALRLELLSPDEAESIWAAAGKSESYSS